MPLQSSNLVLCCDSSTSFLGSSRTACNPAAFKLAQLFCTFECDCSRKRLSVSCKNEQMADKQPFLCDTKLIKYLAFYNIYPLRRVSYFHRPCSSVYHKKSKCNGDTQTTTKLKESIHCTCELFVMAWQKIPKQLSRPMKECLQFGESSELQHIWL